MNKSDVLKKLALNVDWDKRLSVRNTPRMCVLGFEIELFPSRGDDRLPPYAYDAAMLAGAGDEWKTIVWEAKTHEEAKAAVLDWLATQISDLIVDTDTKLITRNNHHSPYDNPDHPD